MNDSASRRSEAGGAQTTDTALAIPVWDLSVRLTHWSLVLLIAFSWWSAEYGEIQWHLWSGFGVLFLLLFRILWGVLGSSTALFRSFLTGPRGLLSYLREPEGWRGIGHTPLGALSVVTLLGLMLLQVWFGLFTTDEDGLIAAPLNRLVDFEIAEKAHEVHELLFNVLLGFIILHVTAILFYRIKGRRLMRAMVTGRSGDYAAGTAGLVAAPASRLLLCLGLAGAITAWVIGGVPGL